MSVRVFAPEDFGYIARLDVDKRELRSDFVYELN